MVSGRRQFVRCYDPRSAVRVLYAAALGAISKLAVPCKRVAIATKTTKVAASAVRCLEEPVAHPACCSGRRACFRPNSLVGNVADGLTKAEAAVEAAVEVVAILRPDWRATGLSKCISKAIVCRPVRGIPEENKARVRPMFVHSNRSFCRLDSAIFTWNSLSPGLADGTWGDELACDAVADTATSLGWLI